MAVDGALVKRVVELVTNGFISLNVIKSLYANYTKQVQGEYKNYNPEFLTHATYMRNFHGAVLRQLGV